MKRTHLNFAIDAAAFAAFLFLLSTGLLLRYQLPPHSGAPHAMGVGRGAAERPVSLLWGLTRHEWGDIHYWVAGALVAILAVHLVLHWKWIVGVVRGVHSDASGLRFGLGLASLVTLMLLAAAPVLAPTQQMTRSDLQQQRSAGEVDSALETGSELRGSMTLAEVAAASGLTIDELLDVLELPPHTSPDERIGRILRRHEMTMSDLRRIPGISEARR